MTASMLNEWLLYVYAKVGKPANRKILLVMDNCSAHGTNETLPILSNVEVLFCPPNTTSGLQSLDAGIIEKMKVKYRKRQTEHAVYLMEAVRTTSTT